jgi:hypothetical protein
MTTRADQFRFTLPPFANEANKEINEKIMQKYNEMDKYELEIVENSERSKQMDEHLRNVSQEIIHTQVSSERFFTVLTY